MNAKETLIELSCTISKDIAAHVAVCEFSSEDATDTLHIDLWRGYDLFNLPECISSLELVSEGFWDGGRSFSLQLAK